MKKKVIGILFKFIDLCSTKIDFALVQLLLSLYKLIDSEEIWNKINIGIRLASRKKLEILLNPKSSRLRP